MGTFCRSLTDTALHFATQDPPQQVIDDCTAEVEETVRVLKNGTGVLIYLTFGQPHFRRRFLTQPATKLEIKELGEAFHYYMYILRT